jgi:hypothetical protein
MIRGGVADSVELQYEDWSVGGGATTRIYYIQDPNSGKWLSTFTETITQARQRVFSGFLRSVNGILMTNVHGPVLAHKATIIGISATSTNSVSNKSVNIYSNGVLLSSTPWSGFDLRASLDVDITDENLSSYIITTGSPSSNPRDAVIQIFLKWRK